MDENIGTIVVVALLAVVLAVFGGILLGAVFLRWSVRILQGFQPPYGRALLVVFLATIASFAASMALVFGLQAAGVFVVAWVGQFVGHHIEGRRPSFFTDLKYLLIGPLWTLDKLYRKLGWAH